MESLKSTPTLEEWVSYFFPTILSLFFDDMNKLNSKEPLFNSTQILLRENIFCINIYRKFNSVKKKKKDKQN